MDPDPFTQVYEALWTLLEADGNWTALVKPSNRIKFSGANPSPRKDEALSGDFPEVRIVATWLSPQLNADSSNSRVTARFEIQVASGDQRFDAAPVPGSVGDAARAARIPRRPDGIDLGRPVVRLARAIQGRFCIDRAARPATRLPLLGGYVGVRGGNVVPHGINDAGGITAASSRM